MSSSTSTTESAAASSATMEVSSQGGAGYNFSSSTIVRTAIAAGIIVLVVCALLITLKVSSWIRYRQRVRRQQAIRTLQENETKARAFELAAWSDTPGQAPVAALGGAARRGAALSKRSWWRRRTRTGQGGVGTLGATGDADPNAAQTKKGVKRGRVNAYALYEWEGVPA